MRSILPVMLCLFFTHGVWGQALLFENYTSEQGISQNSCYSIAQDGNGFMWFGTQDGLNRYDGKEFKVFLPQTAIGRKLPSNYISSLYYDAYQNLLWVGTIRGACLYLPRKDSLMTVTEIFPFAGELNSIAIKKIIGFREYEYWILTYNRGLLLVNTKLKKVFSYFNDSLSRSRINSLAEHDGKLIVAVFNQLYYLSPRGDHYETKPLIADFSFPEIKELYSFREALWVGTLSEGCYYIDGTLSSPGDIHEFSLSVNGIGCFTTDNNGNLWIGTRGNGVARYNPSHQQLEFANNNPYDSRSLGKNFVLSLYKDRQGLIWCGLSGSGVAKYDPLKFQFQTFSKEPINEKSLPDNMVFNLFKCKDGSVFVGTQNKGLAQWLQGKNEFITYSESSRFGRISNTIYDITEDDNNRLWIASWGGLISLDRKNNRIEYIEEKNLLAARKLYSIHKLYHSDSLFITSENGPVFFSLKDRSWKVIPKNLMETNNYIGRFIYEDSSRVLWICTVGAGLVRYDVGTNQFKVIEEVKKYSIYARHLLADGPNFWLATDNGVVVYDWKKGVVVKHINLDASNTSNVCYALEKDRNGFLWVSSNTGLYKINPDNYELQNYDLGNGLSFLEYNTACVMKDQDGSMYFGGVGGITRFNPFQLRSNDFSPAPILTSLQVNDVPWQTDSAISLVKQIQFAYNENFLTFHFAVNNFSIPNKNQFSYRLKGLSNNWTRPDNRNYATYTSLPPGDYTFELRAANSDSKWSPEIASLYFTILPPWWQSWWFRVLAIAAIASVITYLVRRRIAAIRHEAELKHRIAETEMMALRAQMNPHFIFNCINSIDALIQSNDKYRATIYLNKFAKLIRNILDSSKQNMIALGKDVDTLKLYIELEQLRNENKFTAEIHADEQLLQHDYKVPAMIIQPFVENAILHGLRNRTDNNGKLEVSIRRQNGHLEYIVQDNGVGRFAESNSLKKERQSYGMQITNDRVKLFNNETNASVEVEDLFEAGKPAGTRVKLFLKLK